MKLTAVIVAAGQGTRLGLSVPKALVEVGGRPLLTHSLSVLATHPSVRHLVIVGPADRLNDISRIAFATLGTQAAVTVVAGGAHRWESVARGVVKCPPESDWIMVHDAARPFVTHRVVDSLLEKSSRYRAVVTATPVDDTVREFWGDKAGQTLDRTKLVRIGTPQLFRRDDLVRGFEIAERLPTPPTDEAVLIQMLGIEVGIAAGDPLNFKITSRADLEIAEALIAWRSR